MNHATNKTKLLIQILMWFEFRFIQFVAMFVRSQLHITYVCFGNGTFPRPCVAGWFEISVSEKFQPLPKSLKFSEFQRFQFLFRPNDRNFLLKLISIFENFKIFWFFFEFLCSTEIAEIFWPKGNYLGLCWNHWNLVNFNEISLNFRTMCAHIHTYGFFVILKWTWSSAWCTIHVLLLSQVGNINIMHFLPLCITFEMLAIKLTYCSPFCRFFCMLSFCWSCFLLLICFIYHHVFSFWGPCGA